jgi:hypothetical protein
VPMNDALTSTLDEVQQLCDSLLAETDGAVTAAQRASLDAALDCARRLRDALTAPSPTTRLQLRTLVIGIYSGAEMLIRGRSGPLNSRQLQKMSRVRHLANTLRQAIDDQ